MAAGSWLQLSSRKTVLFSAAKKRVISEHSVTLVQSSLVNKTLVVPEPNASLSVFRETFETGLFTEGTSAGNIEVNPDNPITVSE